MYVRDVVYTAYNKKEEKESIHFKTSNHTVNTLFPVAPIRLYIS